MNATRISEAREAATEAKWFAACPEARCRETGRCCGSLRRFQPDGPRCYPTCLKLVLGALLAGRACSPAQDEAYQRIVAADERYWAALEGRGGEELSGTALHVCLLILLAEPRAEHSPAGG